MAKKKRIIANTNVERAGSNRVLTITDDNYKQFLNAPDGHLMGSYGKDMQPRPKKVFPEGHYFKTFSQGRLPLIPENEWQQRLDEQKAQRARFIDYLDDTMGPSGGKIPSRDQDGYGYCWCHSGVSCAMALRAAMGLPYADLSAFHIGCIIKNYRNQGGWGIEGVKFMAEKGCATSKTWPQQSTNRSNDNPDMWAEAAKYRLTEWYELENRNMKAQVVTVLLSGGFLVMDFNWWSHSVAGVALESINPFVLWIWNSWGDSWSDGGFGKLQGSKAIPDDSTAIFSQAAAA